MNITTPVPPVPTGQPWHTQQWPAVSQPGAAAGAAQQASIEAPGGFGSGGTNLGGGIENLTDGLGGSLSTGAGGFNLIGGGQAIIAILAIVFIIGVFWLAARTSFSEEKSQDKRRTGNIIVTLGGQFFFAMALGTGVLVAFAFNALGGFESLFGMG